jgi:hypothetical protein
MTDTLVEVGSSVPSGGTKKVATVAFRDSSTTHGAEQHRYPRYHTPDPSPAVSAGDGASATIRLGATIVVACLIEGILILGLIVASLGVGYRGDPGTGPDRPPRPIVTPAPAPPPGVQAGPFS